MIKANDVLNSLIKLFPDAHCELNYQNLYQLTISVVLSAQTTDKRVNIVTVKLFEKYPSFATLSQAPYDEVARMIKSIGLYQSKAKNIIALSKIVDQKFDGKIPNDFKQLVKLPGIGRKTANVILSEGFSIPAIAVDTHVSRVARRLGIAQAEDSLLTVERKMEKFFPKEHWHQAHQLFVHYGRYICKAQNPDCKKCPFGCPERVN